MMWIEYNFGAPDRLSLAHARGYLRRAIGISMTSPA